ncbi:unnamed protein product [Meganyctiphanes norvegica]|uniref:Uncharacterized protein n=1 Tax=Meganyctiphanes norvegica TaxID=48144 RepID=A0AAV2RX17_MEGNR
MSGSATMYLKISIMVAAAAAATTSAAASKLNNNRIMEDELTKILQEALAPNDPYFLPYTTTCYYTNSTSSIELNATNPIMSGFEDIVVTNFDPPIPLFSKQVSLTTVVSNLTLSTTNYSMVAVCNYTNEIHQAHGAAYLAFSNLKVVQKFKADEYSKDPVRICVKCGTLTIDISYDSVEGNFEDGGLMNSMISIFGEILKDMVLDKLAENQYVLEDSLNDALCNSQEYIGCQS